MAPPEMYRWAYLFMVGSLSWSWCYISDVPCCWNWISDAPEDGDLGRCFAAAVVSRVQLPSSLSCWWLLLSVLLKSYQSCCMLQSPAKVSESTWTLCPSLAPRWSTGRCKHLCCQSTNTIISSVFCLRCLYILTLIHIFSKLFLLILISSLWKCVDVEIISVTSKTDQNSNSLYIVCIPLVLKPTEKGFVQKNTYNRWYIEETYVLCRSILYGRRASRERILRINSPSTKLHMQTVNHVEASCIPVIS